MKYESEILAWIKKDLVCLRINISISLIGS